MGKGLRHFSKEDRQMDNKHMKRSSTSLTIREMQIKTTMRYHFMPTKILRTIIKKDGNNKCGQRYGEIGVRHCWWDCKMVMQFFWKTVWQFLKKLTWSYHMT